MAALVFFKGAIKYTLSKDNLKNDLIELGIAAEVISLILPAWEAKISVKRLFVKT